VNGQGVLVVGYGNTLRGDDGIGWRAAALLAEDPRLADAEVLAPQQLTPELAQDVARASLVVLVDARADSGTPGSVRVRRVAARQDGMTAWSHRLDPAALAGLTNALYGAAPPVYLVSIHGALFDDGEGLSPALEQVLPRVADTVAQLVAEQDGA
jgi:hydrogenase maturation protease